jgi:hypothetical protein
LERRGVPWCIVKFRGAIGLKGDLKKQETFIVSLKVRHEVHVKILSWYLVDEGHDI